MTSTFEVGLPNERQGKQHTKFWKTRQNRDNRRNSRHDSETLKNHTDHEPGRSKLSETERIHDLMLKLHLIKTRKVAKSNERGQVFLATENGLTFLKTYCDLLRIIYGEDFLQKADNLAVACLKYCQETDQIG
jgi:hypothetical protein